MKNSLIPLIALILWSTVPSLLAADASATPTWRAQTLGQAVGYTLLFSVLGVVVAIVGFKLFDKCTPGDLGKEILENRNVAAAIVAGAVILGICIIIAAAMLG